MELSVNFQHTLHAKETFPTIFFAGDHIKGRGCSSETLKRTSKKCQDPVMWAWLEMYFTPKRLRFLHNT